VLVYHNGKASSVARQCTGSMPSSFSAHPACIKRCGSTLPPAMSAIRLGGGLPVSGPAVCHSCIPYRSLQRLIERSLMPLISAARRPKSAQITCYFDRTYHVLTITHAFSSFSEC
jgi:hypothetical protein